MNCSNGAKLNLWKDKKNYLMFHSDKHNFFKEFKICHTSLQMQVNKNNVHHCESKTQNTKNIKN